MKGLAKVNTSGVKSFFKQNGKKIITLCMSVMMLCSVGISAFASTTMEAGNPVAYSDFSSIFTALTDQISVSTIVGVLAAVVGACVGLVFMWWGLRKVVSMLMAAFKKGRISV